MGPPARLPPLTPPPVVRRGLLTLQAWTKPSCKDGNVGVSLVVAVHGGNPRFLDHAQADPGALAAREQHGNQHGIVICAARVTGENRENAEAQRSALIPPALVLPTGKLNHLTSASFTSTALPYIGLSAVFPRTYRSWSMAGGVRCESSER
jgi:hypothetical protein